MSNLNKRLNAEGLYINEGWTAKAIAETVGVSENTVGNWVKKYGWKDKKNETAAAPHKIKQLLLTELQRVVNGEEAKINADTLSKITKALERVDKGVSIQVTISVMKIFTDWITTQDINLDQQINLINLTKGFIKERLENE